MYISRIFTRVKTCTDRMHTNTFKLCWKKSLMMILRLCDIMVHQKSRENSFYERKFNKSIILNKDIPCSIFFPGKLLCSFSFLFFFFSVFLHIKSLHYFLWLKGKDRRYYNVYCIDITKRTWYNKKYFLVNIKSLY